MQRAKVMNFGYMSAGWMAVAANRHSILKMTRTMLICAINCMRAQDVDLPEFIIFELLLWVKYVKI